MVDVDKEKVELGQDHLRKSSGDKKVVHKTKTEVFESQRLDTLSRISEISE